jgi:hypothetical protein
MSWWDTACASICRIFCTFERMSVIYWTITSAESVAHILTVRISTLWHKYSHTRILYIFTHILYIHTQWYQQRSFFKTSPLSAFLRVPYHDNGISTVLDQDIMIDTLRLFRSPRAKEFHVNSLFVFIVYWNS